MASKKRRKVFRSLIAEITGGNPITLHWELLKILSPGDAAFVLLLYTKFPITDNTSYDCQSGEEDNRVWEADDKGFFRCTDADVIRTSEGVFDTSFQFRSLRRLKKLGYVETQRRGIPGKRWLRLRGNRLAKAILKARRE